MDGSAPVPIRALGVSGLSIDTTTKVGADYVRGVLNRLGDGPHRRLVRQTQADRDALIVKNLGAEAFALIRAARGF